MKYDLKHTDLIPGGIYVTHYKGQGEYIFRETQIHNSGKFAISVQSENAHSDRSIYFNNGFKEYRIASCSETRWLLNCEAANKYLEYQPIAEPYNNYEIY